MNAGAILPGDTIDLGGFRGKVTTLSRRAGGVELSVAEMPYPVVVPLAADVVLLACHRPTAQG